MDGLSCVSECSGDTAVGIGVSTGEALVSGLLEPLRGFSIIFINRLVSILRAVYCFGDHLVQARRLVLALLRIEQTRASFE